MLVAPCEVDNVAESEGEPLLQTLSKFKRTHLESFGVARPQTPPAAPPLRQGCRSLALLFEFLRVNRFCCHTQLRLRQDSSPSTLARSRAHLHRSKLDSAVCGNQQGAFCAVHANGHN